jgi:hypothetical protein
MTSFSLPAGYPRIQRVNSFHELVTTPFAEGVNALCWVRTLPGDFSEAVGQLCASEGIATLSDARLRALSVSAQGRVAIDVLLEDQRLLREHGLAPVKLVYLFTLRVNFNTLHMRIKSVFAIHTYATTDTYTTRVWWDKQ